MQFYRVTLAVLTSAVLALPLSAQSSTASLGARGPWAGGSVVLGRAFLDQNSGRPWQQVGSFGLSTGGSLSLGVDGSRIGIGLDLDASNFRVGNRPGSSLALAAVARWVPRWQPIAGWNSLLRAGYVRYMLGRATVAPGEIPPGTMGGGFYYASEDMRLSLLGNGVRLGYDAERPIGRHAHLVVGLGADAVHFGTANYQGVDLSLDHSGWGLLPRLSIGARTHW